MGESPDSPWKEGRSR